MHRHDSSRVSCDLATRLRQLRDAIRRNPDDIEAHLSWLNTLIKDAELLDLGGDPDGPDRR